MYVLKPILKPLVIPSRKNSTSSWLLNGTAQLQGMLNSIFLQLGHRQIIGEMLFCRIELTHNILNYRTGILYSSFLHACIYICDWICQKVSCLHTVSSLTFHRHLTDTTID